MLRACTLIASIGLTTITILLRTLRALPSAFVERALITPCNSPATTTPLSEGANVNVPVTALSVTAPFKAGSSADNYVDIKAGGLAIRDLSNLYKYDNTVSVVKLTGSDVKEWVEFCANMFNTIDPNSTEEQDLINRDFPTFLFDVIDGIEYEIDVTQPPKYNRNGKVINANSSRISKITYNGQPIDLEQEFLIATNNYRAGGNSFPWQGRQEIVYTTTEASRDVLKEYIDEAKKAEKERKQ